MAHEDQFSATGPAFSGSLFPFAGFSNAATDKIGTTHTYGVNVIGTECGVYGEIGGSSTNREAPVIDNDPIRTGVCGVGDNYGVFGKCMHHNDGRAGVRGETNESGSGVLGVAKSGVGVAGI